MAKLVWDNVGEHYFETGVSNVGLSVYDSDKKAYGTPVAWNGVTSISESADGADANAIYADNIKYLNLRGNEEFGFTIEAYTYPDEWCKCDGLNNDIAGVFVGQQSRSMFGLFYVTRIGDDVTGSDFSEKIHIIYGATASPSEKSYETVNDSPDAIAFSWDCDTTPVDVSAFGADLKKASIITIDKRTLSEAKYTAVKNALFGTDDSSDSPKFLTPAELYALVKA